MKALKRLFFFVKPQEKKYLDTSLCGVSLKTLPGTIRLKEDQDDAWWYYLAKHHDVIYDIGCNVGYTALLSLIHNPNKVIILIDPNPKALQQAAINIIKNGIGGKVHYQAAFVSSTVDDLITFYTIGSGAAGSMYASHAKTAALLNSSIKVKTVTLDSLYKFYNLKPDLIKIDVEGAETLVMQGAKEVAKETSCSFFIEMHNVENLGMEAAGQFMINWCEEMGYHAWYLKKGEQLTLAETIKDRGKCHLLLLPKDECYPEYLKGVEQNAPLPKSI